MNMTDYVRCYFDAWDRENRDDFNSMLADTCVLYDLPLQLDIERNNIFNYLMREKSFYKIAYKPLEFKWVNINTLFILGWEGLYDPKKKFYGHDLIEVANEKITSINSIYGNIQEYKKFEKVVNFQTKSNSKTNLASSEGSNPITLKTLLSKISKYEHSALTDEMKGSLSNSIVEVMEKEHLYLNSELRISDIAERCDTYVNNISETINDKFMVSFNDFINEYRIRHAKKLLRSQAKKTILEIALDSGFNAHSSFYKVFKKQTLMSPRQYRKMNRGISNESMEG